MVEMRSDVVEVVVVFVTTMMMADGVDVTV